MKSQIFTLLIIYVIILTGCSNAKQIEEQQSVTEELIEVSGLEDEFISEEEMESVKHDDIKAPENTLIEEGLIPTESTEAEVTTEEISVFRTIPVDEVVFEENDVVFVISKMFADRGPYKYGYLISAGGKVVPFQILLDDYYGEEIGAEYGNILDIEKTEPITEIEDTQMNQYIEKMLNIDSSNEMENKFNGYDYEFEHVFIYGRKVDCDKYVDYADIYRYTNYILEPTDPNAIELMNWLLELNETLTEET